MEVPFCAETGLCGAGHDSQPLICFLLASWAACSQACGEVALVWPFLEEGGHQSWLSGGTWQAGHLLGSLWADGS